MNHGPKDAAQFFSEYTASGNHADVGVAPPYVSLAAVVPLCQKHSVLLFAQNISHKASGAFTGEISAAMLKEVGCAGSIIGHSERRQIFFETDALINARVIAALEAGLNVIFCLGETLEERKTNRTNDVIDLQLKEGLKGVAPEKMERVTIAYEPVWAIGTGLTATPEQAQEAHLHLRGQIASLWGQGVAQKTRILYGGSVKPELTADLIRQPDIDGFLVGGASLKPRDFMGIIQASK